MPWDWPYWEMQNLFGPPWRSLTTIETTGIGAFSLIFCIVLYLITSFMDRPDKESTGARTMQQDETIKIPISNILTFRGIKPKGRRT